jgi:hypothetical protein
LPPIDAAALSKTPWVVGAVAILVGLVLYWFGSIISAFASNPVSAFAVGGVRGRLLALLAPGAADWAAAILIAVALLVLGSSAEDKSSAVVGLIYQILLLAAAAITVAAAINAVLAFTYIGDTFDGALTGFFDYLAGVPIAAAAGLWVWRAHPSALPVKKGTAR